MRLISQILRCAGQQRARRNVAVIRGLRYQWKYFGENGAWPGSRLIKEFVELALKCFKNLRAQGKCLAVEMFLKTHRNCPSADIVRASRVADHRAKPASARQFKWRCPSQNCRTCPRNRDNTGNFSRGPQGKHKIAGDDNRGV